MPDSPQPATAVEVVPASSTRDLYEEVLAERVVGDREAAKKLLAQRVQEVIRLKALLAKAEAGVEELLQKDVAEIAAIADRGQETFFVRFR
jgi:hypothetical protein